MKLFIYEHITSGALSGNSLPVSLANEGHVMLMAVLHDCAYLNGMLINTMRDQRLKAIEFIDDHPQHNFTSSALKPSTLSVGNIVST